MTKAEVKQLQKTVDGADAVLLRTGMFEIPISHNHALEGLKEKKFQFVDLHPGVYPAKLYLKVRGEK